MSSWEIGVQQAGDRVFWEHYHPHAESPTAAKESAKKSAIEDGLTEPFVYMVAGPFGPTDNEEGPAHE